MAHKFSHPLEVPLSHHKENFKPHTVCLPIPQKCDQMPVPDQHQSHAAGYLAVHGQRPQPNIKFQFLFAKQ